MYLKFLAVEGFKSFPEWNGLELSPGVCVLVGQNGTGKSNLTDAVSWALGEEDLDLLRVRGPEDVVFAGTPELLPLEAARVSLVLDPRPEREKGPGLPATVCKHGHQAEHSGQLPEGVLTLTRELQGDGTDLFWLNGCESSRDEVRATLQGLGVAFPPVSVIRQGELERLLLVNPDERRRLLEEAAGIPHLAERLASLGRERDELRLQERRIEGERLEAGLTVAALEEDECRLSRYRELEARAAALRAAALTLVLDHLGAAGRFAELHQLLGLPDQPTAASIPPSTGGDPLTSLADARHLLAPLSQELAALGPVNGRASEELARTRRHLAGLEARGEELARQLAGLEQAMQAVDSEMRTAFDATRERIEERFRAYYSLLAPGGEAALPLVPGAAGRHGVEVAARPPGKILDRVSCLSGGERSLAALSFALALFQEHPAPFFVLDEVEPALDDSNIRRVQAVLDRVADQRQLLVVSHQQRAKETGDVVFGVERNLDGASQVKFRYEPRTRQLDIFRRTWAADHLRRDGRRQAGGLAGPQQQTTLGSAGSPTQAVFAEIFGPASGSKRGDYFKNDGTFRGIWDAYEEKDSDKDLSGSTEEPQATPVSRQESVKPGGADEEAPPKCCC